MLRRERRPSNLQGEVESHRGLRVIEDPVGNACEAIQRVCDIGVYWTERGSSERQRLPIVSGCLLKMVCLSAELGEVVQGAGDVGVGRAKCGLPEVQCLTIELPGLAKPPKRLLEAGEIVEQCGVQRLVYAWCGALKVKRFAEERFAAT